jgi:hypothetical protein
MTPKFQDVALLTSLLIDGTLVIGRGGSINRDTLCHRLLGQVPSFSAYKARHFTVNTTYVHDFYWDELDTQLPH